MRTLLCALLLIATMAYAGELHKRDAYEYIKKHEGLRLHLYKDKTGKLCIGWGHNIEDLGIDREVADLLFEKDYQRAYRKAIEHIPFFLDLDETRQLVIIDMIFNLGIKGVLDFRRMLQALEREEWDRAAEELLKSKYAKQCPDRAKENARLLKTGTF